MPSEQSSQHCHNCEKYTLHQRPTPSHWIHGILTLLTCVWGIVWIIVSASCASGRWICQRCGSPALGGNPFKGGQESTSSTFAWFLFSIILVILFAVAVQRSDPEFFKRWLPQIP